MNQLEYAAASEKYARALRLRPGAVAAVHGYRHAARMAGKDPSPPPAQFEKGAPDPTDGAGWYERGNLHHNLGDIEEAFCSYKRSTQFNPADVGAWAACGMALVKLQRYDEAIAYLHTAITIDPVAYWPIFEWGNALRLKGKYPEAIEKYKEAIRCQSRYPDAWYGCGIALAQMRRFQEAIEYYKKAVSCDPDFPWVYYDWGDALRQQGYDASANGRIADAQEYFQQAVYQFDRAIKEQDDYVDAWYLRSLSLVELERYDEALKGYDRATAANENRSWIWRDRGLLLAKMKKHEEACASFNKAVALDAKDALAWYLLAQSLAYLARHQEALTALRKADSIKPGTYFKKAKSDEALNTILPKDENDPS